MMYFDAAATTMLDPAVKDVLISAYDTFGNSSSQHYMGKASLQKEQESRAKIAALLGMDMTQIIPCHGGTDGNQQALRALSHRYGKNNIYASGVEHSSIRDYINPKKIFNPYTLENLPIDAKVIFCMKGNNETGAFFDIQGLRKKFPDAIIVSDFVQCASLVDFDFSLVDIATFAAHKFYGPKGTGFLYIKSPEEYLDISKNSHTRNTPAIMAMAKALEVYTQCDRDILYQWNKQIEDTLLSIPDTMIHDHDHDRLGTITNVSFLGVRGSQLMMMLSDKERICVSTGSACMSDILAPSVILQYKGVDTAYQYPIRISLHKDLKQSDVDHLCEVLPHYVGVLRQENN